jgi:hypothetical protein
VTRSLVVFICLAALPRLLAGQADTVTRASAFPRLRLTFAAAPFTLREPPELRAPWLGAPRLPPRLNGLAWDSTIAVTLDSARTDRAATHQALTLYGQPAPTVPADTTETTGRRRGVLGLSPKYADLALDGQVRLELRTDRLRNERCSPALLLDPNSGCRGGFKAPRLDNEVNLRSGGTIGRRVHVNVDFDTERDFNGNNDVQIYYQGLEDEIIRRIEIGTVNFQPPRSRFITAAIPANNFGINASFEVGPIQLQALAAAQKGSQVADRVYTVGETTSQPQDRHMRDLDFETGRFYWVVDPTTIPAYPALDILNLANVGLPAGASPAQVQVYRYRAALQGAGSDPNLGGITAVARSADARQTQGPVRWELLIQGTDYYMDPSGLWFALSTKLDQNDFLAISYRTVGGTLVGSLPNEDNPAAGDSLRLVVDPQKGPEFETFRHEMRQIYRVGGADLDRTSLQVNLSLNKSERPLNGSSTYLALLGLSIPTDPNLVDRENRVFPRARDPDAVQVVRESFIVFPHLTPFADPARLTPPERADSLYRTPLFLLLSQTPAKFEMRLRYNTTGAGDRSTLSLGALQIREGSEQLTLRGRRLERGVDYSISYELGQVTFLNPEALFGTGAAEVSVKFEEQELFAVAPTSIFGLATRYSLGDHGEINLLGMYQREQSAFNRPPLGFEASANLIGGINTALHFKPGAVGRILSRITSRPATAPSLLDFNGELAFTKPDPNRSGQAYLEEFEADAGVQIPLRESIWEFGSRPADPSGLEEAGFAAGFDLDDAVALVWQNLIPSGGGALELRSQDIDTLIRIVGRGDPLETPMFLTLHADTAGGLVQRSGASRWSLPPRPVRPRWRSMVTPLSATGLDLTQDEYLEFWVFQPASRTADSAGVRLVFDLGTVDEDAVGLAPATITLGGSDTSFAGRRVIGAGRLDTERTRIDIFNAEVDDVGILGDRPDTLIDATTNETLLEVPLCQRTLANSVPVFPWGDLSSRCSRGNGTLDSEDLNGDNVLNASGSVENVFRYVVSLQAGDKYYVRDGVVGPADSEGRRSKWELYRIPIRTPDRTIGTPNLRLVQHMRVTVIAPPDNGTDDVVARFALARLKFVGSPWVRRAERPIAGLSGATAKPVGDVIASIISTENRGDLGYESPPGVLEGISKRGDIQATGTQINEKSLRLIARQLEVGDRAEAYLRFPTGPQNVLSYRQLRVWTRGRGPGWEEGDLQAFIKLGSDNRNFYLYRTAARSTTWDPELIIDLETWRNLRAALEQRWLSGEPPSGADQCGGDANAFVACDGPYIVHLADPGVNPPNLAGVQEISAGIYRVAGNVTVSEAELWVDDIRLDRPVSDAGTALAFDARLAASDVGTFNASYSRQDGQFRQINTEPTYRTSGTLQLNSSWQLDRFLPTSLGITLPVSVSYARNDVNPQLLTGSDLRGDRLVGLRRPQSSTVTYNVALRRTQRGTNWITKGFLDPFAVTATLIRGRSQTELSSARSKSSTMLLSYNLQMERRGPRLPLGGLIGALPKWIRESEAGKGLQSARLSLVPSNVRWSSGLTREQGDYSSFSVAITRPTDGLIPPTLSLSHLWRNSAGVNWQPLGMLGITGDLISTRDLRVYPDSTPLGRLAYAERRFLLGIPVGVERDRTFTTSLRLTPRITSWLRPRFTTNSNFLLSRTLTSRPLVRAEGDSGAFILPTTLNNLRSRELGASLDLSRALRLLLGDSSGVGNAFARIRPVDLSSRLTRSSTFDLSAFEPSLGYMLALGGLERFLNQEGSEALGVSETRTTALTSGAELPLGFSATISYALTRTTRFQQLIEGASETSSREREWPVGSLRWNRTFTGGPLSLVAAGMTFRRREGQSAQPAREGTRTISATRSSSFTPDLQVSLRNGMALSVGFSSRSQRMENNGNSTLLDQDDLTASFNHSFRLPFTIGRVRKQVRSSLTALTSKSLTCLERRTEVDCTVTSDVRRQEIRGGLDTDLAQILSGGLQFGYSINDAAHLSRRTSQVFLMLTFQLSLYAGDYK